jgi:hypothetical protein
MEAARHIFVLGLEECACQVDLLPKIEQASGEVSLVNFGPVAVLPKCPLPAGLLTSLNSVASSHHHGAIFRA